MGAQGKGNLLGQFAWLRSRAVLLAGVIIFSILLIVIGNGNSQASIYQKMPAVRQQKDFSSPLEYQFTGQGELTAGSAETWVVGGVPVIVDVQTQTDGKIRPGDSVSLVGYILENGSWVAERIVPITEKESFFSFAGPLESISEKSWQVAGVTLAVGGQTFLGDAIPIGELVLATFTVQQDDSWLALQIQALSVLERARTPTVTPIPSPTPSPEAPKLEQNPSSSQKPAPKKKPPKPKKPPKKKKSSLSDNGFAVQYDLVTAFYNPDYKQNNQVFGLGHTELNKAIETCVALGNRGFQYGWLDEKIL